MAYIDAYKKELDKFNSFKNDIEFQVTFDLKQYGKPLIIGNMVYKVIKWGGKEVPAYIYLSDYKPECEHQYNCYPIWDRESTGEFGWYEFDECCRIFDLITNTLKNK